MAWAPDYCTTDELSAYVRIPADDVEDVVQLGLAIAAASRAIDRTCKRQFGLATSPVPRYYTAVTDPVLKVLVVNTNDLQTTVGLVVEADTENDGTYSTAITGYLMKPGNAPADGVPWSQIAFTSAASSVPTTIPEAVRVTARWGWTTVPDSVKQATLLQASRLLSRRDSPFGVAGSPEAGSEMRLLAKVDPDVAVLLRHYTRRWWAV